MCAEHGVTRSASASAPSLSAFFIIIFSKYERARSTGRDAAAVHSVLNFRPFLKMLSHARRGRPLPPGAEVHSTELKIVRTTRITVRTGTRVRSYTYCKHKVLVPVLYHVLEACTIMVALHLVRTCQLYCTSTVQYVHSPAVLYSNPYTYWYYTYVHHLRYVYYTYWSYTYVHSPTVLYVLVLCRTRTGTELYYGTDVPVLW